MKQQHIKYIFVLIVPVFLNLQVKCSVKSQVHLHHNKLNHSQTLILNSRVLNQTIFALNQNFFSAPSNKCKLHESDLHALDISLQAYLAPTVVKVTAIEKFKYFRTFLNFKQEKVTRLKSYSVLFQVNRIFKYEHVLAFNLNSTNNLKSSGYEYNKSNQTTYVFLSKQDEYSSLINLNSFFLVENFEPLSNSTNATCQSSLEIELNKNYILFLNSQDVSVEINKRNFFTHPIRVDSKRNIRQKKDTMTMTDRVLYNPNSLVVKSMTKMAIFVRVPIFYLFRKPIKMDDLNYQNLERRFAHMMCQNCGKF